MPDAFVLGALQRINKTTAYANDGDVAVVVSLLENGAKANIMVFSDFASAERVAKHVATPMHPPMDPSWTNGAKKLMNFPRNQAQRLCQPTTWQGFFTAYNAAAADAADLVGTTVKVKNLPHVEGTYVAAFFDGDVTVTHATGRFVDLEYQLQGQQVTAHTTADVLRVAMASASNANQTANNTPLDVPAACMRVAKLIGALPASKSMTMGKVATSEALETIKAALEPGLLTVTDPAAQGFDAAFVGYCMYIEGILAKPGADARSWPNLVPARLGDEIKKFASGATGTGTNSNPPPNANIPPAATGNAASRFPRVDALRALALDTPSWDAFHLNSTSVTMANKPEAQRNQAANSEYIRDGCLEAYLKSCGDDGSVNNIRALTGALNADMLLSTIMIDILPTSSTSGSGGASGSGSASGSSSSHAGISLLITPDNTGTTEDKEKRSALRGDAEDVCKSDAALAALDQLADYANRGDDRLVGSINAASSEALKRLVRSEDDVQTALQGDSHLAAPRTLARDIHRNRQCTRPHEPQLTSLRTHKRAPFTQNPGPPRTPTGTTQRANQSGKRTQPKHSHGPRQSQPTAARSTHGQTCKAHRPRRVRTPDRQTCEAHRTQRVHKVFTEHNTQPQ